MIRRRTAFELVLPMLILLSLASSQEASEMIAENFNAINESDPVYWLNKGEELLNEGKYNESIEAFDEARHDLEI